MAETLIELTDEQLEALEKLAQHRNISVSDLIQEGIDMLVQLAPNEETDDEELRRRAIAVAGRYKSGLGDLARNHDHYLTEPSES